MKNGSAVDAVEAAVRYMEDSGEFNAGRGACLTAEGTVQLDAAIMEGEGRGGAGVGLCECTHNPVSLTRFIMEKTDHALIAGEECARFARLAGIEIEKLQPSAKAREIFAEMKEMMRKDHPRNYSTLLSMQGGNTVGAVATDTDGLPAAAVSTGGTWMKLPGRIGDSAILGAGIYADGSTGAACSTGRGAAITGGGRR
jgi:beta-aspartyl-peptidase (threonine type)